MRTDLALAALASAAVPGMKPVAVAGIAPSDDDRARELQSALVEDATGRRWVVRAPLTPVAGARLQRNDELVRQLSRHVPFKVPAAAGYAPVGKDGSAAVYPHVEGSPLDLGRLPAGPGLASALGRALAAVHNIPRAVFEEQDVPVFDASGARQRAIADVDRAAETGRVPTGLLARWEDAFEAAPLWQFATTPVHGSFTGASVVVAFTDEDDAASGRVVALTDWDEAMVGDPAVDLAELWSRASRAAWDSVLDAYSLARAHRPDPYIHARARLVAELRGLRGLARAVAEGDEETTRRCVEALRRMDRLTEADDSLVPLTARPSGSQPLPAPDPAPVHAATPPEAPAGADDGDLGDPTTEVPAPQRAEAGVAVDDGAAAASAPTPVDEDDRWSAPEGLDDADATMQIPPVTEGRPEADEAPGVSATAAGVADEAAGVSGTASTEDELPSQDGPAAGPSTEDMTDDHGDVVGSEPGRMQDPAPVAEPAPADVAEPMPGSADEPEQATEGAESGSTEGPESDLTEGGAESGSTEGGEGRFAEPEDLRDEERLTELYGMPAPEHDRDRGGR